MSGIVKLAGSDAVRSRVPASETVGRPSVGQVRVRHGALGLSAHDAAGTVDAVGPDVVGFVRGDRVAYRTDGDELSQVRLIDATSLVGIPSGVTDEQAAAFLSKGLLARMLVKETHPIGGNETVLVQAAAGVVGSLTVAWAKALGATVIATVGTNAARAAALRAGADHVFVLGAENVPERVREVTGGAGADVVYDGTGTATLGSSARSVRSGGVIVAYGASAEQSRPLEAALLAAGVRVVRPSTGYASQAGAIQQGASDLFMTVRSGAFDGVQITRYPFADATRGVDDIAERRVGGAVVLLCDAAEPAKVRRSRAGRTALAA
jgi:NADPH2:quinone reductase